MPNAQKEEKWNFCLILFFKFSDQFFVIRMVEDNRNQSEQTSSAASFGYCSDFGNESNGILR